jgi:hypothetical protein
VFLPSGTAPSEIRLFSVRFAHDSPFVLAAIHRLACMYLKGSGDFFLRLKLGRIIGLELCVAAFTNTDSWEWWLYDSQLAVLYNRILA